MRFAALDSWRGISALLVALFHFDALGHFYAVPLIRNGYLFVDFFFVLSGFVISHAALRSLNSASDAIAFLIRRFGRVWPLHALMLFAFIAFPLLELSGCHVTQLCGTEWPFSTEQANIATVLSNLALVHSLGLHVSLTWNWPSWSISTEFYTYVLFALSVVGLGGQMLRFSVITVIICAIIIALVAPQQMESTYDFGYFRCVLGFFVGFLTYKVFKAKKLSQSALASQYEVIAVAAVFCFLTYLARSHAAIAAPFLFAVCVYLFAHEHGWISQLLKTRPLLKLGELSYSIYMVHAFILIFLLRAASALEKVIQQPLRINADGYAAKLYFYSNMYVMDIIAALYLVAVILLASITYRHVEEPARAFFNGKAQSYQRRRRILERR